MSKLHRPSPAQRGEGKEEDEVFFAVLTNKKSLINELYHFTQFFGKSKGQEV